MKELDRTSHLNHITTESPILKQSERPQTEKSNIAGAVNFTLQLCNSEIPNTEKERETRDCEKHLWSVRHVAPPPGYLYILITRTVPSIFKSHGSGIQSYQHSLANINMQILGVVLCPFYLFLVTLSLSLYALVLPHGKSSS